MKIAFLSRHQNTIQRGAEVFVAELAKELSKNNEVVILSGKDADSLSKIMQGNFDVAIAMNGRLQSLKASLGRIISGYKLVITGQSGIGRDDVWNIAFCRPDAFVALTDHMLIWAKKWAHGVKIIKIPNGVDLERFSPKGSKIDLGLPNPIVLSVGALTWYKHHELAINAISKLENVSLLIVGKGEEKEKLTSLGKEKLGDRFSILNFDFARMPKLYKSCDLFTLPSWDREAFGLVYLEAMASNLPVIAPNDLSRKEIVGDGGVLVDVSDPAAYSNAIQKALNTKWGNRPREQAEKFSWEKIAKMYEKTFQSLGVKK